MGEGTGEMFEAEWHCNGSESYLLDCQYTNQTRGPCDHRRDAGVYCSGKNILSLRYPSCDGDLYTHA